MNGENERYSEKLKQGGDRKKETYRRRHKGDIQKETECRRHIAGDRKKKTYRKRHIGGNRKKETLKETYSRQKGDRKKERCVQDDMQHSKEANNKTRSPMS